MSLPEPSKRVGDAERRHVLEQLTQATGSGYLDLTEFEERSRLVAGARTRGDLDAVIADLPVPVDEASSELKDNRKIAALSVSFLGVLTVSAFLGLPWLILLAPTLILMVWLSGRGPSGFYRG